MTDQTQVPRPQEGAKSASTRIGLDYIASAILFVIGIVLGIVGYAVLRGPLMVAGLVCVFAGAFLLWFARDARRRRATVAAGGEPRRPSTLSRQIRTGLRIVACIGLAAVSLPYVVPLVRFVPNYKRY